MRERAALDVEGMPALAEGSGTERAQEDQPGDGGGPPEPERQSKSPQ